MGDSSSHQVGLLYGMVKKQRSMGYCNEQVDESSPRASAWPNARHAPFYHEISTILNQELPKIWLWYEVRPMGFNKRIVGLGQHFAEQPLLMFDIPIYNEIHTWYTE
ncbi:MAG: hypothetical protein HZY76_00440 [Anaerolineae bacterium]|nr:MAG: hypothetical protein HZY76_00440 [Anaerolineae bacterium]